MGEPHAVHRLKNRPNNHKMPKSKSSSVSWKKKKSVNRPKGTVISGLGKSKYRLKAHSLALGTIPKVGSKDLKYYDTAQSNISVRTEAGGTITPHVIEVISKAGDTDGIIQGNKVGNRVASKVYLKQLSVKALIGSPALPDVGGTIYGQSGGFSGRLLVVQDRQSNETLADADDVLEGSNVNTINNRFINYSNTKRFRVLADKSFTVPSQTQAGLTTERQGGQIHKVECVVDLTGITTQYVVGQTTGLFGDIVTNNLYVIWAPDHVIAQTSGEVLEDCQYCYYITTRVYYTG